MSDVQGKRDGFGIGEAGSVPATDIGAEMEAERIQPTPRGGVLCDCGHTVPRLWVMNTSTGTSCPACYDMMSEGGDGDW